MVRQFGLIGKKSDWSERTHIFSKNINNLLMRQTKLKKIIEEKLAGKNLLQLSKELDIPKSLLHDWISVGRLPSLKNILHLKKLADYLGLTIDELFFEVDKAPAINSITFTDEGRHYKISIERID